jgi:predicted SprT family Zn-dependent metalloprotease
MDTTSAARLARQLMDENGLTDWRFAFDRAARRFGCCSYGRRQISLSWKLTLLNDAPQVRKTILHEIAHALTPGAGHGAKWKAMCRRLGIADDRCFTAAEVSMPARRPSRFEMGCLSCGWWQPRHRLTASRLVCKHCKQSIEYRERRTGKRFRIEHLGRKPTIVMIHTDQPSNGARPSGVTR